MQWYNEPPEWSEEGDRITVKTAKDTDFWRTTRHHFIAENGHFYYQDVTGDFTAEVRFTGEYVALYDQAGLMVRENEQVWLKCGIEYLEGVQQASAVVTREFSDWSVVALPQNPKSAWFRMMRIGSALEVYYSLDGDAYTMIRQAYLTQAPTLQVGLMACTPKGEGFTTVFEGLRIQSSNP